MNFVNMLFFVATCIVYCIHCLLIVFSPNTDLAGLRSVLKVHSNANYYIGWYIFVHIL